MPSADAEAPDLDPEHLNAQTAGDRDLQRELLALFREQAVRQLGLLASADGQAARDAAHTLLGAARAVGATRIAALAARAERADGPDLAAIATQLRAAVADADAQIDRIIAGA